MLNKVKKFMTGFRKFSVMLILIAVCIWFRLSGYMSGDNITELLKVVGSAFMAGNLVEHITDVIKKKMEK